MADKIYDSVSERNAARNERRRKAYKNDPDYRKDVRENAKQAYREKNNVTTCKHIAVINEQDLVEIGEPRIVKTGVIMSGESITFDVIQTGLALGDYEKQVIYRWLKNGNLPPMRHKAGSPKSKTVDVYVLSEIREIARILRSHQENISCYYRSNHEQTKNKIAEAVAALRGEQC